MSEVDGDTDLSDAFPDFDRYLIPRQARRRRGRDAAASTVLVGQGRAFGILLARAW